MRPAMTRLNRRPTLKLRKTGPDKLLGLAAALLLLALWSFVLWQLPALPERMPIHFDHTGQADAYGHKNLLLILPGIATVLAGVLSFAGRHPEVFNYRVPITAENAERQYRNAALMMRVMRLVVVALFFLICWKAVQVGLGQSEGLGLMFLPLVLGLVFAPVVYFALRSRSLG